MKRHIGPLMLTLYGLGGIIGAGVFALTGEIVGTAGTLAPFAFLLAGIPAVLAALSYSSLASALPEAGGELSYVDEAFGARALNLFVLLAVFSTGILACATLVTALSQLLAEMVPILPVVIGLGVLVLAAIATAVGLSLSVWLVVILTVLEVGALLVFIVLGRADIAAYASAAPVSSLTDFSAWWPVIMGASIAFFAFIGFEDMVNMAQEVKRPAQSFPVAILAAFGMSLTLYVLLAIVAQAALAGVEDSGFSKVDALAVIAREQGFMSPAVVRLIAVFSIANGVLIQINMASRLLLGAAQRDVVPSMLGTLNPVTGTPLRALTIVFGLLLVVFLVGTLQQLAQLTSLLVLVLFVLVNLSLIVLLRRPGMELPLRLPLIIPVLGVISAGLLILTSLAGLLGS